MPVPRDALPLGERLKRLFTSGMPLRRRAEFADSRLRRDGSRKVDGAHRPPRDAATTVAHGRSAPDDSELMLACEQLGEVLDRHASARKVLRHLAVFESALRAKGPVCLQTLPVPLLGKALVQLGSLADSKAMPGLATLHAWLTVTLVQREAALQRRQAAEPLSDFQDERKLQIGEASASDFAEAEDAWEKSMTGQRLPAA